LIYINGKFLSQRTTGVQRVAEQLVIALDRHVSCGGYTLLCHPSARKLSSLRNICQRVTGPDWLPLSLWEQWWLPSAARSGTLVNLAGSAPAWSSRSVNLIHDAAVFDVPFAYRKSFVTWYRWLFRRLGAGSATLATVSSFSQVRLSEALKVPNERIAVIHNGADHLDHVAPDLTVLDKWQLRSRPYVLCVGSFNPTKNLQALVEAFPLGGEEDIPLVIVGGGHSQVFQGHLPVLKPSVLAIGAVNDAQLVALYQHAALLAYPSLYEGFGLPPLEAMRQGCPVVATPCGALPEVLGDAANYARGTDATAISTAIHQVLNDARLRTGLISRGRSRSAEFSWDQAAKALLELLEPERQWSVTDRAAAVVSENHLN
jgi:glycosyltransferase involved in cell wall biosynthesis